MTFNYFLRERIKLIDGQPLTNSSETLRKVVVIDSIAYPEGVVSTVDELGRDFPRLEHLQQFRQFKWRKLFDDMPHPLWAK